MSFLDTSEDLFTVEQCRQALHIGKTKMYSLIEDKKIKHVRVGKKILIPKSFLEEYLLSVVA